MLLFPPIGIIGKQLNTCIKPGIVFVAYVHVPRLLKLTITYDIIYHLHLTRVYLKFSTHLTFGTKENYKAIERYLTELL